jgi:uncharacterized damage-inducible protein DinB
MTLDDLQHLLEYHYWARDRMLDAVTPLTPEEYGRNLASSFPSIHATLVHTYSAEWAWHSRWEGRSPTVLLPPEMFPDVASLRAAWVDLEARVHAFLASAGPEGPTRRFAYTLLSGAPGESTLHQMVQHVVNHATYHRGQVTTMLRQLGAAPPKSTDVIQFWREWDRRNAGRAEPSG